jgi:hypothetical protein
MQHKVGQNKGFGVGAEVWGVAENLLWEVQGPLQHKVGKRSSRGLGCKARFGF